MRADFYNTANDRLDFNKQVVVIDSNVNIQYKDDTNLIEPVFRCRADKWEDSVNYIEVVDLERLYFVESVTFSQMYVDIKCTEDVLASHRSEILKLSGIIERTSTKKRYNLYLQDDKLKTFNMTRFCTIPWSGSFRVNGSKTYSYILTLSGGGSNGNNNNP